MSFFKKKDEDVSSAYKPTGDAKEKKGTSGGKGGGEPAEPKYDPQSDNFQDILKKKNEDGKFGYGYVDPNTGVEVPWYIDMINGGGANAAGPEFVSPFAELPLGGGMASMPTNLANAANIAPYGYNQPRRYAQAGMLGYPTAAPTPQPTGGGSGGGVSDAAVTSLLSGPTTRGGRRGPRPVEPFGYPSMNMPSIQGYTTPMPQPAAAVSDTAMTTPSMDFLMNMAQNTVMTKYPTMPAQEQRLRIDQEYQKLAQMLGY